MPTASVPSTVSLASGPSVVDYYKAFINYINNQCKIHADKVFARYYSQGGFKSLTYAQVDLLATNLACKWANDAKISKVVSFIADHTVTYLIIMLAMLKMRVTMMAISPRNSEAADANLLEKTQSKLLVAHVKYENVARAAAAQVSGVKVLILNPLDIDELLKEPLNPDYENLLDLDFSDEDRAKDALIIHSSGSTSFPKPIYLSNRYLFNMISYFHITLNGEDDEKHIDENDAFLSCAPL
jgi:acyl-CoA synthetase (AMP-forming)/AMP-acid ligase II